MMVKTDEKHRGAPEGAWVPGDGIKRPYIYLLCGTKVH